MSPIPRESQRRAEMLYNYKLYSFKQFRVFSKYAWKTAREVSQSYGGNRLCVWLDMMWCNIRFGAMHTLDYTLFEFYKKNSRERNTFLTTRRYYKFIKSFDKDTFFQLSDKPTTYRKYADFIHRDWLLVDENTSDEDIKAFIVKSTRAIVKPISSDSGKGVFMASINEGETVSRIIDVKNHGHGLLVEGIVENCEELKTINPSSLNTLRVDVMVKADKSLEIFSVHLRCGCGDTVVDNWGAGGVAYPVDIETGIINAPGMDFKRNRYIIHPGTNKVMPGYKIPRYEEACQMAKDIISRDIKVMYAGLDLAIMPDGIELIEINFPPAPYFLQSVDLIGRRKMVENLYMPA